MLIRKTTCKHLLQTIGISDEEIISPVFSIRMINTGDSLLHFQHILFRSPVPPVFCFLFFIRFNPHSSIFLHTWRESHDTVSRETHIEIIVYCHLSLTFFRCYQNHTVGSLSTVNRSRTIFQHTDTFYIIRIQILERGIIQCRDSIHYNQDFPTIYRCRTTNLEIQSFITRT